MPEELNRLVTDALSDVLWTPSSDADENLRFEGIPEERITRVGNIMMDSFEMVRHQIEGAAEPRMLGLEPRRYGVVTLHRPSNVDAVESLTKLVGALIEVQLLLPLVFPVHPRTAKRLAQSRLDLALEMAGVRLVEPLSYVRFMSLVLESSAVITDSGGIQEETTYLGIPCLTLRENTERPVTISEGTNQLTDAGNLRRALGEVLGHEARKPHPELWDGCAAQRCIQDLRVRTRQLRDGCG
jgi:UDP-N-acetylglucosamine 2-epimerase (non-hydrolysing)